jgi:hypothetical protein
MNDNRQRSNEQQNKDKEMAGALWDNTKTNDRCPDLTGTMMMSGKIWRVAAWYTNSDKPSYPRLTLRISEPRPKTGGGR